MRIFDYEEREEHMELIGELRRELSTLPTLLSIDQLLERMTVFEPRNLEEGDERLALNWRSEQACRESFEEERSPCRVSREDDHFQVSKIFFRNPVGCGNLSSGFNKEDVYGVRNGIREAQKDSQSP